VDPPEFAETPLFRCVGSYTCPLMANPDHGYFKCDDIHLPIGTGCTLVCDRGYLPEEAVRNVCLYENITEIFYWQESDMNLFKCVPQIGLIVGGVALSTEYLSSVEVFAPSQSHCHGFQMPDYPTRVMGAAAGRVGGVGVVCGGAIQDYVDCARDTVGKPRSPDSDQHKLKELKLNTKSIYNQLL